MMDRLKENALLCFTLSLVVSYFACFGYFSFFYFDITSFLSIEDLTMIFAKWIWLSGFLVAVTVAILHSLIKRIDNQDSWWDKTIGKTPVKRRALIVFPAILATIISAFAFKIVSDVMAAMLGIGFVILIIVFYVAVASSSLKNKNELSDITSKDWVNLISAIYFFIFAIPFLAGVISASSLRADNVYVKFDDNQSLNSADSTNLTYIGKTSNYFYITNSKTKTTTAYNMDKVKSFEIIVSGQP